MDLRDLWRGRMSWRRLGVLIDHLPPESATRTEMREANPDAPLVTPTGHGPWSRAEQLLAGVADELAVLSWQLTQLGGKRVPPPKRIPRPGLVEDARSPLTAAARAFLEARRAKEASARD